MSTKFFRSHSQLQGELQRITRPVCVLYVSSYIPRKCGIATFTKDLTNAVNLINPLCPAEIAAMDNQISESLDYPHEVKFRIRENVWADYRKVINTVNKDDHYQAVCLEHEYGIYGGPDGDLAIRMVKAIKKPILVTLHTVLAEPSPKMKKILQTVCQKATFVVVMLEAAAEILEHTYGIDPKKIAVIHHGVPDFPKLNLIEWKKRLGLEKKVVMTSINLLSEQKGIEYAIRSLPQIKKEIPNIVYQIVGQTHPVLLKQANGQDTYREYLTKLVNKLKVSKYVSFVNRYVSLSELVGYIGATDYYVTPYLNPQQAASGALAYAIGAGKVCISTPYLYAKEMLSDGRGQIVDFLTSQPIAETVVRLTKDGDERGICE
ncbi:MAG: glycosyltransferase, partial [Patescibacteria group bacterium]|nr:glycosyltransferase [Patescibacteria group bacterium]